MGLISGSLGNATEIDVEKVEKQVERILVPGEELQKAFSLVRDLIVLSDKRLILIDKQGLTGKKAEFLSIPYKNIHRFAMETAGHTDLDSELKIWLSGLAEPLTMQFKRGKGIYEIYRVLSTYVLA